MEALMPSWVLVCIRLPEPSQIGDGKLLDRKCMSIPAPACFQRGGEGASTMSQTLVCLGEYASLRPCGRTAKNSLEQGIDGVLGIVSDGGALLNADPSVILEEWRCSPGREADVGLSLGVNKLLESCPRVPVSS